VCVCDPQDEHKATKIMNAWTSMSTPSCLHNDPVFVSCDMFVCAYEP